jgi:hypothetical protein
MYHVNESGTPVLHVPLIVHLYRDSHARSPSATGYGLKCMVTMFTDLSSHRIVIVCINQLMVMYAHNGHEMILCNIPCPSRDLIIY